MTNSEEINGLIMSDKPVMQRGLLKALIIDTAHAKVMEADAWKAAHSDEVTTCPTCGTTGAIEPSKLVHDEHRAAYRRAQAFERLAAGLCKKAGVGYGLRFTIAGTAPMDHYELQAMVMKHDDRNEDWTFDSEYSQFWGYARSEGSARKMADLINELAPGNRIGVDKRGEPDMGVGSWAEARQIVANPHMVDDMIANVTGLED